jgi:hypothetical protein
MLTLHDVQKVTIKRKSDTSPEGIIHNWTTFAVTHTAHGYNSEGVYGAMTVETEITLHHRQLLKVPFRFDGRIGA